MATISYPQILLFFLLALASAARVPATETFSYANSGEFGPYIAEYGTNYRVLPIATSPFQLCFFNSTPGAFYLALRMATRRSESIFRFVWTANPTRPVGEKATFSLLSSGDLRLTDADGTLVFSSGTANKGVSSLRLLPNGNIVLVDARTRTLWQSFDHPTDSLLVGQSLPVGKRLVSRLGTYSLTVDTGGLGLYINNVAGMKKPLLYSTADGIMRIENNGLKLVTFEAEPLTESENGEPYAYELRLSLQPLLGTMVTGRPKYNATLSFLRMEEDGNLSAYTYYDPVDYRAWELVFALFSNDLGWENGCRLPYKCGAMGVCTKEMCVACPRPGWLAGWEADCSPPASTAAAAARCRKGEPASFYKVEGVDTFLSRYEKALERLTEGKCMERCNVDCSCLGFLYREKEARCWLAPVIGTLEKTDNSSHFAWIKYYK